MLGKLGSKILPMLTSIFGQVKTKSHNTKTAIGDAIHYYKAVRRLIVLYISLIWLWMLQIAARMYVTEKILDANYTNLCMAVTAMVGTCYAFYFTSRSKETIENCHTETSTTENL